MRAVSDLASLPDEVLLGRVARHDPDAFLALYDRFAARLLGLIKTVVHDRVLAEDVLQQVMMEIWQRHAARYQPLLGAVDAWLLRLARSRAIDQVRALGRNDQLTRVAGERATPGLVEPSMARNDSSEHRALRAALTQLPDEEREPVVLAYVSGMSRDEIATHLGIPTGTVKTRIRRGVHRLREALTPFGEVTV